MKLQYAVILFTGLILATGCRKGCTDPEAINFDPKAKKDNNSCQFEPYSVPATYFFTDENGNPTVYYGGQTDRLNQLSEMVAFMKAGTETQLDAQALKDLFANTNDNGNGNFSFSSVKQLKDKCFDLDQSLFEGWMDSIANASVHFASTASNGQAGTLTTGSSTYLFDANGIEHLQLIEKGLMGAVFMYQALNVYFGEGKMSADNTTAVDPANGKYYTAMEHHWDEAFGYFGVEPTFPATVPTSFWGKYSNAQNETLDCNTDMMSNFLMGRAALSANVLTDRDAAIAAIRTEWESISAYQAMSYLDQALTYFGNDNAKFLHVLSEAYAFSWNLRYAPEETRRMTPTEHTALMAMFKPNFWNMGVADIHQIKSTIDSNY